MKIGIGNTKSALARLCALSVLLIPVTVSAFGEISYKSKRSGNEAFAAGDYQVAAKFYELYAKDAENADDSDAVRDAGERRLDALLLAGMTKEAEKEFADYELKYPGVNSLSLSLWKAELRILQGKYKEALTILRRILPGMTADDPRRLRTLAALARTAELCKNYAEAAKAYGELAKVSADNPLGKTAYLRKVFCLANTKKPQSAMPELLSSPSPQNEQERRLLSLLTFYVHLKTDGAHDLNAAWLTFTNNKQPLNHPIAYTLCSAIGDEAAERKNWNLAHSAYWKAYSEAPDKQSAFETLNRITLILEKLGDIEQSARLATSTLELFKGPYATPDIKLRMARIFRSAGKYLQAIELYLSLIQDKSAPRTVQEQAVRECAYLQNAIKDTAGAKKTIRNFYNTAETQPEADFLFADLLLRSKRNQEAAEAFQEAANKHPSITDKALYQSALAWLSAKNTAQAENVVNRLLALIKNDSEAYPRALHLKAMILEEAKKIPEAQKTYIEFANQKKTDKALASRALFKAAKMSFIQKNQLEAETLFKRVMNDFPESKEAPLASYWRIYSFQSRGDDLLAERETWHLVDRYPGSQYATDALFNLATHYADSGASSRANAVLDTLLKRVRNTKFYPKVLLEKANLAFRDKDTETALALLEELYGTNPDSSCLAEASYLHADVLKSKNNYEQAVAYYTKVLELHPDPLIELAAAGSIADCQFTMAAQKNSIELFRSAMTRYNNLLSRPDLPEALRIMQLYKSGRCAEELDEIDTALKRYKAAAYTLVPKASSAVALWGAKSVEAIVKIAEKAPLKAHVETAIHALQRLADAELMEQEIVDERILKLEKMKFKP